MADEAKENQHDDTRESLVPENAPDVAADQTEANAPGDVQAEDQPAPEEAQGAEPPQASEPAAPESEPESEVLEVLEPDPPKRKKGAKKGDALPEDEPADAPEAPEEAPALLRDVPDDGIPRRWYAIHAHSGQEGSVKKMLLARAEQHNILDLMSNVFVPMEEVAEIRGGEKKVSKRKYFPGYVLVQLPEHPERYPDLWHLIRQTPGVTGFIGSRTVPVPLEDAEVQAIVEEIRGERERPKPKVDFDKGERVKIIDGPFANFVGSIDEVNAERGTVKVLVEIFERLTSVEVEFWQVEHI
ncbi:MAG: transcription termination/antitermination protein NusG [Candidatus Hydrogenedentota bacterium]